MPLLGLGLLFRRIRRTQTSVITMQPDRSGVRVHLTVPLSEAARVAALQAMTTVASGSTDWAPAPASTAVTAPPEALVTEVPGAVQQRAAHRTTDPLPVTGSVSAAPQLDDQRTMTASGVRALARDSAPTFVVDDGQIVRVEAFGLLGRDPAPGPGDGPVRMVVVPDATRSVSKTHLAFGRDAGGVWVADRGSTNGSTVLRADGQRFPCPPGQRVAVVDGDTVQFGDRTLVVRSTAGDGELSPSTPRPNA